MRRPRVFAPTRPVLRRPRPGAPPPRAGFRGWREGLWRRSGGRSLRWRLLALLLLVGGVPTLALGLIGLRAVAGLGARASVDAAVALRAQAQGRLLSATEDAARQADADFAKVQTEAAMIAAEAAFIYGHPGLFPGIAQGNTPLVPGPGGDLVNSPSSPVGVFAPAADQRVSGFWPGVALIGHIDPMLRAVAAAAAVPPVRRFWVMTTGGLIRAIPNPGFGQPGSPVGPDRQLTGMAFYALGTPAADAARAPRWTPPYADPAGGGELTSAIVPVYTAGGVFHGVAGADVSLTALRASVATLLPPPFHRVVLFTPLGQVLASTPGAPTPAQLHRPAGGTGSLVLGRGPGALYAAYAALPTPGWMLAAAVPASVILAPGRAVAAATRRAERRVLLVLAGGVLALGAGLVLLAREAAATVSGPLRTLAAQVRALGGQGESDRTASSATARSGARPHPLGGDDEVGSLATEFAALVARLDAATARWRREAEERARAELAVLQERNRIAREVHDTLAQGFMAILLLSDGGTGRLAQIGALARDGLRQARRSMAGLTQPPGPPATGQAEGQAEEPFAQTVREELRRFVASLRVPVEASVRVDGWPAPSLAAQVALLGVLRSALGNVREHAAASRVAVVLGRGDRGEAVLEVSDDGRGFDPDQVRAPAGRGRGLIGMRQRLAEVGGALEVCSAPARGTRVRAAVPPAPPPA